MNPIHINPAHKGLLHKDLGVPAGESIPASKLAAALHSKNPAVRKRAVFAKNAKGFNHPGKPHRPPRPSMPMKRHPLLDVLDGDSDADGMTGHDSDMDPMRAMKRSAMLGLHNARNSR